MMWSFLVAHRMLPFDPTRFMPSAFRFHLSLLQKESAYWLLSMSIYILTMGFVHYLLYILISSQSLPGINGTGTMLITREPFGDFFGESMPWRIFIFTNIHPNQGNGSRTMQSNLKNTFTGKMDCMRSLKTLMAGSLGQVRVVCIKPGL